MKGEREKNEEQKEIMNSNIQDFYENFEYMVSRLRREIILVDKKTGFSAKEEGDVSLLSVFIEKKASWVGDWKFRNEVKKLKSLVCANEEEFMERKQQEEEQLKKQKNIQSRQQNDLQLNNSDFEGLSGATNNFAGANKESETVEIIKQEMQTSEKDAELKRIEQSLDPDIKMTDTASKPETSLKQESDESKKSDEKSKYSENNKHESANRQNEYLEHLPLNDGESLVKQKESESTEKESDNIPAKSKQSEDTPTKSAESNSALTETHELSNAPVESEELENVLAKSEESDSDADLFGEVSMDDDDK